MDSEENRLNFYISDLHFNHKNVLHFDSRPFADTATMEEVMINNWNQKVAAEDTVYVLGDAFWRNEENSIKIMQRLNGHKHLIKGNHDRVRGTLRACWESVTDYLEVTDEGHLVVLSHYPMPFYKNQHYGAVMLYGHVHNSREWEMLEEWQESLWENNIPSKLINVGCMMPYMDYTPRSLIELLDSHPWPLDEKRGGENRVPQKSYKKLWYLLIDRKMKKSDLAAKAGVCPAVLQRMKQRQSVSRKSLEKIAGALGVGIDDIVETIYENPDKI